MQAEVEDAETDDGDAKNHGHDDHENVGLTWRRYEHRQMVSRNGINLLSHDMLPQGQGIAPPDPVTPKPTWTLPSFFTSKQGLPRAPPRIGNQLLVEQS